MRREGRREGNERRGMVADAVQMTRECVGWLGDGKTEPGAEVKRSTHSPIV